VSYGEVSISDEKPLHMRLRYTGNFSYTSEEFQSQTRSRSTCDVDADTPKALTVYVSISDEKPLHMRRR